MQSTVTPHIPDSVVTWLSTAPQSFQPNDGAVDEAEFDDTLLNVHWMQFIQYAQRAGGVEMGDENGAFINTMLLNVHIHGYRPWAYVSVRGVNSIIFRVAE